MEREERVVRQKENRDRARDAMRSLFKVAWAKVRSGVGGDLPLDEMQDAKEYFRYWKRKKLHEKNKLFFFMLTLIPFFLFHPQNIDEASSFAAGIGLVWTAYVFLEWDKRKRVYVQEMLGDLSHLSPADRDFYIDGLLHDLWRVEKEELRYWLIGISYAFILAASFVIGWAGENKEVYGAAVAVALIASMIFFSQDVVRVKRVKNENISTE